MLHEQLRWLEGRFDSMGPFFMGAGFSLVDASLLPFFLRLPVLQQYRSFSLPTVPPYSICSLSVTRLCAPCMHNLSGFTAEQELQGGPHAQ
jgi:hypothetical protein